jgi:hypothetical protein
VFFSDNSVADVSVTLKAHFPAGGYYFSQATLDSSGIIGLGDKSTASISYPTVVDEHHVRLCGPGILDVVELQPAGDGCSHHLHYAVMMSLPPSMR